MSREKKARPGTVHLMESIHPSVPVGHEISGRLYCWVRGNMSHLDLVSLGVPPTRLVGFGPSAV